MSTLFQPLPTLPPDEPFLQVGCNSVGRDPKGLNLFDSSLYFCVQRCIGHRRPQHLQDFQGRRVVFDLRELVDKVQSGADVVSRRRERAGSECHFHDRVVLKSKAIDLISYRHRVSRSATKIQIGCFLTSLDRANEQDKLIGGDIVDADRLLQQLCSQRMASGWRVVGKVSGKDLLE